MTTNKALTLGAVAFAGFALWAFLRASKPSGGRAEQAVSAFFGPNPAKPSTGLYSFDDPEFRAMVGL